MAIESLAGLDATVYYALPLEDAEAEGSFEVVDVEEDEHGTKWAYQYSYGVVVSAIHLENGELSVVLLENGTGELETWETMLLEDEICKVYLENDSHRVELKKRLNDITKKREESPSSPDVVNRAELMDFD